MPIVLVYSEDPRVRSDVRLAMGHSPAPGVDIDYLDADSGAQVFRAVDEELVDLLVLDGEAWPTGGLGISRELHASRPERHLPVVVLIGRRDDRWLAKWSQADAVLQHPIDPVELTQTVVGLLGPTADAPAGAAAAPDKETP